jgi:subfamily B ATP-binding cassette protein MsbA
MTSYLKFINPFKRYPGYLVATGVCTLFYVAFNALSLWLVAPVLKVIFLPGKADAMPVPAGQLQGVYESFKTWSWQWLSGGNTNPLAMLPRLCVALIVVFALKNVFAYGQMHFVSYVEQRMIRDLRDRLFEHVAYLPYSYFDKRSTGELMSNVMNDVNVVSVMFQRVFTQAVRDPLTVITLLVILISISWQLTLTALVILPLFGFIYRLTGRSLKRKSGRIQAKLAELSTHLQEAISGARLVKASGTEGFEVQRFEKRSDELLYHGLRLVRLDRLAQPLSETIGVVIIALVLLFGGHQVLTGELLDAEDFIRFIVILFAILAPIRGVGGIFNNMQVGSAAGARLEQVFAEQPEAVDVKGLELTSFQHEITFDHVWFKYPSSPDWVLRDIDLTIQHHERIALVGRSGSGKSTLANLIPRFYEVEQGQIRLDGQPVNEISLRSLRRLVSTVSQDVFLFNDTVRYNICYGLGKVDEAALQDVIRRAHATDFIHHLPQGLETVVGERGTQLSGGQRQRIAIARALLRNSPILIFDEATSALDSESERLIQRALDELFKARTVIIIAHRLSSIRYADRIVLLDEGQMVDTGTHLDLLARSPLYGMLMPLMEQDVEV